MFEIHNKKNYVDYSNMLLPPKGYELEFAVATTYSLDITALTSVCLSLGFSENIEIAPTKEGMGKVFLGIQKMSKKLLIFCDAGQIKSFDRGNKLAMLLDKMIIPVSLPKDTEKKRIPSFHPKTWLLKYQNKKDPNEKRYRFAILSRNLTFDKSFNTALFVDGELKDKEQEKSRTVSFMLTPPPRYTPHTSPRLP